MSRPGKIVCWVVAYVAIAWAAVRLAHVCAGLWSWSAFLPEAVPVVLAFAFKPMLVLAWFHGEGECVESATSAAARAVAATGSVIRAFWSICRRLVGACLDTLISAFGRRT